MKKVFIFIALGALQGCANTHTVATAEQQSYCIGSTAVQSEFSDKFLPIQDDALLSKALGAPLQGKLCQGAVYQSTHDIVVYRAWNSTNPKSQFGQWWSFSRPSGLTADYRKDFEICYQWSPLDKLVKCTLKAGTKVVVGNGQSAKCSEYLSYPVSESQQLFIVEAQDAMQYCETYDSVMRWE
ncbi:hypothetical protein [Pseudoalteromonas sp. J010]|uniref:hypothetical protein n=1 Tax=Pseudoalteromonas sp. J010 TaxID=998465 RepID=UPI00163AD863|nr:hypothetical protein [Pseudoalteromonas sp. J010]